MSVKFKHNPASQTITVKKGETSQFVFVSDKGLKYESDKPSEHPVKLVFDLKGADSDFEVIGLIVGHGEQDFPFDIQINHISPKTIGRVWLKSVLTDAARQTVNAMISIPKGANGADSHLSHRTLVLSPKARTKTIPSLEILEDDVKASHGATVSRIDKDQLFYLQSRGLSEPEAKNMIVDGFMEDLVAKIKDEKVQNQVRKLIK